MISNTHNLSTLLEAERLTHLQMRKRNLLLTGSSKKIGFVLTLLLPMFFFAFSHTASAATIGTSPQVIGTTTCSTGLSCGLVGYWTFDGKDMAGGKALDKSGNGRNGTLVNIATSTFYTSGKLGQGLKFDGVNDYVVSMNNPISSYPFSMSVWVKAPTVNGQYFAISYANTTSNTIYYSLGSNGNVPTAKAYLSSRSSVGDENAFAGTINLAPNKWTHLVAVFHASTNR